MRQETNTQVQQHPIQQTNNATQHKRTHRLGVAADRVGLPGAVGAAGVRLVERGGPVRVEAHDERRDAKRPDAPGLGVALLHPRDVLGEVVHRDGLVQGEAVRLRLDACAVDEHARVGGQAREREADVVVDADDLAHRARVLQARGRLALDA